jgi:anti-sigma-K factor RskA
MDIKEYIDSGIVAAYVLELASESEQKEFESLCKQYPELREAKRSFELQLEDQLMKEAVPVPEGLKESILGSLGQLHADKTPPPAIETQKPTRKMNWWKMLAAACIVLLAGSIYFTSVARKKYQALQTENTHLKQRLDGLSNTNPLLQLDPLVQKPSVKLTALMKPNDPSHCLAHVYWDTATASTFLLIGNIPPQLSQKQFHLWALADKQAINLGMFDAQKRGQLLKMKDLYAANEFVITIEEGETTTPRLDATYAIGKL